MPETSGVSIPVGATVEICAVITRADGTVIDLGTLDRSDWGRWRRLWNRFRVYLLQKR